VLKTSAVYNWVQLKLKTYFVSNPGCASLNLKLLSSLIVGLKEKIIYIFASIKQNIMQTINVKINIDSPTGRRLLKEVERHPKVAKIEYPVPDSIAGEKTYTIEEEFSKVEEKLNNHYGTSHKLKY